MAIVPPVIPDASNGTGWVARTHPHYKRRNSQSGGWEFLRVSYEGGQEYLRPITYSVDFQEPVFARNTDGTLVTVAQRYDISTVLNRSMLYRHNREKEWEFYNRNKRARYFNFVKPIVNSLVSHAMKAGVLREGPKTLADFWHACDEDRTQSMDEFMRTGLRKANALGIWWACVDVADTDDRDGDGKPYVYGISPQDILDWSTDEDGEIEWVKQFIACEAKRSWTEQFQSVARYRIWTKTEVIDYEVQTATVGASGTGEREIARRPNTIGRVPLTPIYAQQDTESDFPHGISVVADLAKVANSVFNHCSLADEIAYKQTFAWLIVPDPLGSLDTLQLGLNTAFAFNPGTTGGRPEYISPDADSLRVLMELIGNEMEQAKSTIGFSRGRSEGSKQQASADALELESDDKKALLGDVANAGQDAEKRIADLVLAYRKQETGAAVRIVYDKDFDVRSFATDVDEALSFQKLGLPTGVNTQLITDLVRRKWGESLSPDKLKALLDEIEAKGEEMEAAKRAAAEALAQQPAGDGEDPVGKPMTGMPPKKKPPMASPAAA